MYSISKQILIGLPILVVVIFCEYQGLFVGVGGGGLGGSTPFTKYSVVDPLVVHTKVFRGVD